MKLWIAKTALKFTVEGWAEQENPENWRESGNQAGSPCFMYFHFITFLNK